jgi:hypothetical protein
MVVAPVNLKGASRKGSLGSLAFWRATGAWTPGALLPPLH